MRWCAICLLVLPVLTMSVSAASAQVALGASARFAVLGASTVTNSGPTLITGDLGVTPGSEITGFPPGTLTGDMFTGADPEALDGHSDATTAYFDLESQPCNTNLTDRDLGGLTLTPGVYCFDSSAFLTGLIPLTLDAQGDPDAVFIFQTVSTLITGSNSSVEVINGDPVVYWQVGSSATLGADSRFVGNILALTSITLNHAATVEGGRALALEGGVTMDTNNVSAGRPLV